MDKEFVKEIIASGLTMLTELAETINKPANHIYSVIVRQQIVSGLMNIIGIILFFILMGPPFLLRNSFDEEEEFGLFMVLWFFAVVIVIVAVAIPGIQRLMNPEFYAIEFIIDNIKK